MTTPRRALLVEIVNADQTPGRVSSVFPLLKGLLGGAGVATRWVRFGVSTTNLLQHGRDTVTMSDDDLATLLGLLDLHRPEVLYATDTLYEAQQEAIERRVAGPCFWQVQVTVPDVPGLPHFAGPEMLDDPSFTPDPAWEPGNPAASRREIDNVPLLTYESCGHRGSIDQNPGYRQLDDDRVVGRQGCAFCTNSVNTWPDRRKTPLAWVHKQVRALAASRAPSGRYPNALLLARMETPDILEACIEALIQTGLAAHTQLLVAVRTDRAASFERFVRAGFAARADSGLRIGVYASGIESFAADDLARFNKQTTPEDGLGAIAAFRRLQADFPGRFSYEGLTFILFTPWTTLETLHLNVGLLAFLRFTEIGNLFEARLRLHPDLPITALAERDGAVVAEEPDPVLVSNRRKLFEREVPWRFLEPRLRPVARLALRFDLGAAELDDPLLPILEARLAAAGFPRRKEALLDLLLALVDVARAAPDALDETTLLDEALGLWSARQTPPTPSSMAPFRLGARRVDLDRLLDALAPLVASGPGPVASVTLPRGQLPAPSTRARLQQRGLHVGLASSAGAAASTGPTLVLARSADALERALALVGPARGEGPAATEAIQELGRLHGVPTCCAEAFARDADARALGPAWAALARRSETPGPVPAELNPLLVPALAFVPCRADCAAAADVYRAWGATLFPELIAAEPARAFVGPLDAPDDGELVSLRVTDLADDALAYTVEVPPGPLDPLARTLLGGDRLTFRAGQVRVARGDQTVELFTASHAVWSPERAFHPAAWRELARARAHLLRHPAAARSASSTVAPTPRGERSRVVGELLDRILHQFAERFAGVGRVGDVDDSRADELRLDLALGGHEIGLVIRAREGGEPAWVTTEHLAVSHRRETPVAGPADRRTVHALCVALERALARVAPHLLPGARP